MKKTYKKDPPIKLTECWTMVFKPAVKQTNKQMYSDKCDFFYFCIWVS